MRVMQIRLNKKVRCRIGLGTVIFPPEHESFILRETIQEIISRRISGDFFYAGLRR